MQKKLQSLFEKFLEFAKKFLAAPITSTTGKIAWAVQTIVASAFSFKITMAMMLAFDPARRYWEASDITMWFWLFMSLWYMRMARYNYPIKKFVPQVIICCLNPMAGYGLCIVWGNFIAIVFPGIPILEAGFVAMGFFIAYTMLRWQDLRSQERTEAVKKIAYATVVLRSDRQRGDKRFGEARRELEDAMGVLVPDETKREAVFGAAYNRLSGVTETSRGIVLPPITEET